VVENGDEGEDDAVKNYEAQPVSDIECELGEAPRWDGVRGEFVWVDILGGIARRARWTGTALEPIAEYRLGQHVGAVNTVASGGYIAAAGTGFVHIADDGTLRPMTTTPAAGVPVRMNDAVCDPDGRFWAGTVPYDVSHHGAASLFRLDPDGIVHLMLAHVTISNGLVWSRDRRRLYYADSIEPTVWRFDLDEHGEISGRHAHIRLEGPGVPDGMYGDEDDHLWVAINGRGEVHRFDPTGRHVATVTVPHATQTSSCALGGPEGRTLFVTTAFENMPAAERKRQPAAGLVHAVGVDVAGPPMVPYAGSMPAA
jgi:sugar lactone lactonase YvrE